MRFARTWDDLRNQTNAFKTLELEREERVVGKSNQIYSCFRIPLDHKIKINNIRFGVMWGFETYNYNSDNNTIVVFGDYKKIGLIYK